MAALSAGPVSQLGSLVGAGGGGRGGEVVEVEVEVRSGVGVGMGVVAMVGLEASLGAILGMVRRVYGAAEWHGRKERESIYMYIYEWVRPPAVDPTRIRSGVMWVQTDGVG